MFLPAELDAFCNSRGFIDLPLAYASEGGNWHEQRERLTHAATQCFLWRVNQAMRHFFVSYPEKIKSLHINFSEIDYDTREFSNSVVINDYDMKGEGLSGKLEKTLEKTDRKRALYALIDTLEEGVRGFSRDELGYFLTLKLSSEEDTVCRLKALDPDIVSRIEELRLAAEVDVQVNAPSMKSPRL